MQLTRRASETASTRAKLFYETSSYDCETNLLTPRRCCMSATAELLVSHNGKTSKHLWQTLSGAQVGNAQVEESFRLES